MRARRRRERFELNADINVVSLIDVMLLLLVIFMITAPMMQGGVDLSLPKVDAKPMEAKDAVSISVARDGVITINGNKLSLRDFRSAAKALLGNRARNGVYLRADENVPYGVIVEMIAIMQKAGIDNIGFATEPEVVR